MRSIAKPSQPGAQSMARSWVELAETAPLSLKKNDLINATASPPSRPIILDVHGCRRTDVQKILRLPLVMERTGLSRSGVYADPELNAARIKIGRRAAGWPEERVSAWIEAKIGAAETAPA